MYYYCYNSIIDHVFSEIFLIAAEVLFLCLFIDKESDGRGDTGKMPTKFFEDASSLVLLPAGFLN